MLDALLLLLLTQGSTRVVYASNNFSGVGNFANYSNSPGYSFLGLDKYELVLGKRGAGCPSGQTLCNGDTCCLSGDHCCPDTSSVCCPNDSKCFGSDECCPNDAETCSGKICCQSGGVCCSGSPTGCCVPGGACCASGITPCCPAETTCCGDTCCSSGESCVDGQCFLSTDASRTIALPFDSERDGQLLKNICTQADGNDIITLSYSGALSADQEAQQRSSDHGCNTQTCTSQGLSCNEFPPVGTTWNVAIANTACIPAVQNAYQGMKLSLLISSINLVAGDQFDLLTGCSSIPGGFANIPSSSGGTTSNAPLLYPPSLSGNGNLSYVVVPLGDLGPGTYTVNTTVTSGATIGGFVSDNAGNNLTTNTNGLKTNESQQYTFAIDTAGQLMGIGLMLATFDNTTNATWSMGVTAAPQAAASNNPGGPSTSPNSKLGAAEGVVNSMERVAATVIGLLSSLLLL